MDANNLPTKRNLILSKQNLIFAKKGHDLLDKKLNVLMREKIREEKIANALREELRKLFLIAERARVISEIECGVNVFETSLPINIHKTCAAFDEAFFLFEKYFSEEKKLLHLEEKIGILKRKIDRTKKRASALRNIVIPEYEKRVKFISERLEENERDELIRLKSSMKHY